MIHGTINTIIKTKRLMPEQGHGTEPIPPTIRNIMHKEKFYIYRRDARKGSPAYSPKPHSAPHYEGRYIEGMEEWASWYCINKKDDGTYEAELDEAWDEGNHYGGGTITVDIPKEWFDLPYDDFLGHVVTLAAASHYGFTADDLKQKKGLKEFLGYDE